MPPLSTQVRAYVHFPYNPTCPHPRTHAQISLRDSLGGLFSTLLATFPYVSNALLGPYTLEVVR